MGVGFFLEQGPRLGQRGDDGGVALAQHVQTHKPNGGDRCIAGQDRTWWCGGGGDGGDGGGGDGVVVVVMIV